MMPKDAANLAILCTCIHLIFGDACKKIAVCMRGAVAGIQFNDFHKVCFSVCLCLCVLCVFVYVHVLCVVLCACMCLSVCLSVCMHMHECS